MCGITVLIGKNKNYEKSFNDFMKIKNRGPDMSSFNIFKDSIIGFHRLAIMDLSFHANQPYIIEKDNRTVVFVCNGEIYNFKELNEKYNLNILTNSDCLVIPKLYLETKFEDFVNLFSREIKGEFSFILIEYDEKQDIKHVVVGRDQIGIRPLYMNEDNTFFCSEIKGMSSCSNKVLEFPPGFILCDNIFYNFRTVYTTKQISNTEEYFLSKIRNSVIESVRRRLIADKPIAFLLSGGVDSSLVAGIASNIIGKINTFCCGMEEGTDLFYARQVAEHIKSNHTQVFFTEEEGLNAIEDVIYTIESWDTTTIRASVGQYLVCKYIGLNTDAKVVMVGEGPDEVCSSYLFNYYAPNGEELHKTALEYVENIHMYDGRRADRCISRWGLEGRIALLDPEFIEAYWELDGELRMPKTKGIEKWWLRQAFANTNYICDSVLWRKKEAFSDGVSSKKKSWFQILQDYINLQVSDEEYNNNKMITNCPSKEAYYYKKIFIKFFGEERVNILPNYWQPKFITSNGYVDPSARTLNVYEE